MMTPEPHADQELTVEAALYTRDLVTTSSRTKNHRGVAPQAPRNWRSAAACRFTDPDLFFPLSASGKSEEQVRQAKAICAACPVRLACLAFALRTHQTHGIWGGLTEEERYRRRNLAREERAPLRAAADSDRDG